MMHLRPDMIIMLLLLLGLVPGWAQARTTGGELSGSVLYGTAQYRAEVDGEEVQRARSSYQQLSFRYKKQGQLGDARLGHYTLMLGYEFNILDPKIYTQGVRDPEVQRIQTDKLLYQGQIVIAPGGLPFRLTAYARDIHQSSFNSSGQIGALPVGDQRIGQDRLIDADIFTDLNNGTHREFGTSLLLGIRNGAYLGAYRDALSQLPRLLIDYRQIDVVDLSRDFNQSHYRSRDLAFISLNKKDNWVHVRSRDHVDYLNHENDRTSSQVLLGTIDHNLDRQWINLTNWIKISGDLSLNIDKGGAEGEGKRSHVINLLAVAQRENARISVLSDFARTTHTGERLTQEAEVPIYFLYTPNRDSLYRGRVHSRFEKGSLLDSTFSDSDSALRNTRTFLIDVGAELFRTGAIVFKPRLELEVSEDDNDQGFTEKISLEWSNRQRKGKLLWTAGGSGTFTQLETTNYQEQRLYASAEKSLSRGLRVGGESSLTVGRGDKDGVPSFISSQNFQVEATGKSVIQDASSRFQVLSSELFIEHAGRSYDNRLSLNVESFKTDLDSAAVTEVAHMLKRRSLAHEFTLTTSLLAGDNVNASLPVLDFLSSQVDPTGSDLAWSSQAQYGYRPDRRMSLELRGGASGSDGEEGSNLSWSCAEKLDYRFFTINGIIRKLAEISQELGWEKVDASEFDRESAFYLRLSGALFPTKYFYTKLTNEFVKFGPSGAGQNKLAAETGLNFEKFQLALNYARGNKAQEATLPEVFEERWELKVRKTF